MKKIFTFLVLILASIFSASGTVYIIGDQHVCVNSGPYNGYNMYSLSEPVNSNVTWSVSTLSNVYYTTGLYNEIIYIKWTEFSNPYTSNVHADWISQPTGAGRDVTVHDLTYPTLNGETTSCVGLMKTYTTEPGFSNYIWNYSGCDLVAGGTSSLNYITVKWNTTGGISVNYSNNFGCHAQSPTIKNVTVINNPIVTILGNDSVCGGVHNYEADITNQSGTYEYKWEANNGMILSNINGATCNIGWSTPGMGLTKINVKDQYGCEGNSQLPVVIFPQVIPSLSGNMSNLCIGTVYTYSTDPDQSNYNWVINGGTIISNADTNFIYVVWTSPGYHTINVAYMTSTGCIASKLYDDIFVLNQPLATINGSSTGVYLVDSEYSTESNMTNYVWNVFGGEIVGTSNSNTITINWDSIGTGNISVYYTAPGGCLSTTSTKIVNISPSICMVTYDTTVNKNRIYVNSVPNSFSYYYIYKLNNQSIYEKIGELPTTATSYVDTSSQPLITSNSYKISVVNGFESIKSPLHTTIYLSYTIQSNVVYLQWTPYIGFDFDSYHIYKKIDNGSWNEIGTGVPNTIFNATDTYSGGTVTYFIQVLPECTPTAKIKSNYQIVENYGLFENKIEDLKIYPNPVRENLNIDLKFGLNYIDIYDVNGRLLSSNECSNDKFTLNVYTYPVGLYIIKVKNKDKLSVGKFNKIN